MDAPTVSEPASRAELLRELRALHERSTAVWDAIPTPEFFAPLGAAWSPADNVRHLLKSNKPVARALALPRLALVLRFGLRLGRAHYSYAALRDEYRGRLAGGLRAGRFAPEPQPAPADPEEARTALMRERDSVAARLETALAGWSELALDHVRLPHPALGMLSARELLFFTLYHNLHHVQNVLAYRAAGGGTAAG